jgi:hypothetical protein
LVNAPIGTAKADASGPRSSDQLPYGIDTVTIDLDPGERKLDYHKVKIVAVERGVVGYIRGWAIQHGRGHNSRQISTPP